MLPPEDGYRRACDRDQHLLNVQKWTDHNLHVVHSRSSQPCWTPLPRVLTTSNRSQQTRKSPAYCNRESLRDQCKRRNTGSTHERTSGYFDKDLDVPLASSSTRFQHCATQMP